MNLVAADVRRLIPLRKFTQLAQILSLDGDHHWGE